MNRSPKFARYYRTLFAVVGWLGWLVLLINAVVSRPDGSSAFVALIKPFRTFTVQTNTMVLVWYLAALIFWQRGWAQMLLRPIFKGAFTLYITVTFIVFFIVLQPLSTPQGVDAFTNGMVHYVTPIAFMIDWILFEKKGVYQWRFALYWLLYPLVFLVFALTYGGLTNEPIYPFLDPVALGMNGLATWIAILFAVFLLLGLIYVAVNRFWRQRNYVAESVGHE